MSDGDGWATTSYSGVPESWQEALAEVARRRGMSLWYAQAAAVSRLKAEIEAGRAPVWEARVRRGMTPYKVNLPQETVEAVRGMGRAAGGVRYSAVFVTALREFLKAAGSLPPSP